MLPAPFYSELPTDLGDDSAWCAQASTEQDIPAAARAARDLPSLKAWISQSTNALGMALRCFAWGYSSWS